MFILFTDLSLFKEVEHEYPFYGKTTFSFSERRMVISARVTSWFFISGSIGAMTIPWLMGQVMETKPITIMIFLLGALLVALIILSWICFGLKPELLNAEPVKPTKNLF
jgi:fucose permease